MYKFYLIFLMMFSLSIVYGETDRIKKSEEILRGLYSQVAHQTDGKIMVEIAEEYLKKYFGGYAAERDLARAYTWSTIAEDHIEGEWVDRNLANLNTLKNVMTPKEKDQAINEFLTNFNNKSLRVQQAKLAEQRDYKETFDQLKEMALDQRDGKYMILVAEMYLEGQGVEKDLVQAYSWSLIAQYYIETEGAWKDRNFVNLISLESMMTPNEIAQAQNETVPSLDLALEY